MIQAIEASRVFGRWTLARFDEAIEGLRSRRPFATNVLIIGAVFVIVVPVEVPAQALGYRIQSDTIRGRITTDSAEAIADAEVIVTMAPDRLSKSTRTDIEGRFQIVFDPGTGDYLVYAQPLGRRAFRRRVTRDTTESVFVVDASLAREVQALADVRIDARPQRPSRESGQVPSPGPGAAERAFDGLVGSLPPDLQGDVATMAATMPGITATSGGASALGLPPEQNTATLNGLAFAGAGLPRGVRSVIRAATSTYDPARGGFGGFEMAISLTPGSYLTNRRASVSLDLPQLQTADYAGLGARRPHTSVDLNFTGDGSLLFERWFFNSGLRLTRSVASAISLSNANTEELRAAGVSPDSAERWRSLVAAVGVHPAQETDIPSSIAESVTLVGRVDRPAFNYRTFLPLRSTWGIVSFANRSRQAGLGSLPTAPASYGGRSDVQNYVVQGSYSRYFGANDVVLSDTRTGLAMSNARIRPNLELPEGRVRVASVFDDGSNSVGWLTLGSPSGLSSQRRTLTWQATNETHFYWRGRSSHRGKIYSEARLDHFSLSAAPNRLGTFSYHSLADFAANRPAGFNRVLDWPEQSARRWSAILAVSDLWRRNTRFRVLYGARFEASAFGSRSSDNPQLDTAFGVRIGHVPRGLHVSPRAGFTWIYTRARTSGEGIQFSGLGQFYNAPRGVLRGGIGEFRGTIDPARVAEVAAHSGSIGSALSLACIGDAVPQPDWGAYALDVGRIPTSCADGSVPSYSEQSSSVRVFDRAYQPPRSWRGNLSWSSTLWGMVVSADGIVSLNLNQPSRIDLNFSGIPYFTLADESNRAVFVKAESIVPLTGATSSVDARRTSTFGSVLAYRSDLRSLARQLTVIARPDAPWYGGRYVTSLAYTQTRVRSEMRGFDGATFGDPARIERNRGDYAPRHEFIVQVGVTTRPMNVTLFGKLTSGTPFTPLVGADINGDGFANDRAFVFDPELARNAEFGESLQSLLDHAPSRVRSCLSRQRGRAATRNSCEGPWSGFLNARVQFTQSFLRSLRLPERATVSLNIVNPLGGLDRLLHGSKLRGWGTAGYADPVLYFVEAFDPSDRAFHYKVNPQFGETRRASSMQRVPFRIAIDVSLDLGRPYSAQQLDRLVKPGRGGNPGPRYTADELKKRYEASVPDAYAVILQQSDSLLLTRAQSEAITEAQARLRRTLDSLWLDLSRHIAELPDRYNAAEAVSRQERTIEEAWEVSRLDVQRVLPQVLTQIQLAMLPYPASMLYNAKEKIRARYFM